MRFHSLIKIRTILIRIRAVYPFIHPFVLLMRTLPLPRQRLLNASLAAAFGTVITFWGLSASAQTDAQPAPANTNTGAALPSVTVNADLEENGHVNGYLARRSTAGSKTDTPIIETPQSLSVITADRFQAIGATRLRDALGYTPGVNIAPFGSDSRYDWIAVRGFDAYSPGFYEDGLPLRNANSFSVWKTENYGAERIEVLRGPASVLYGLSSPGGVVNVVSKLPTATPIRELQLQVGSNNHRQVAGDFSGALDADGKVLYRLTGVLRDAQLPAGKMADDRTYLAPSLTWKITNDTTLTLYAQVMRNRAGVYTRNRPWAGSLVPSAIGTFIPAKLFQGNPYFDHFNQDQELFGYNFEHRFNDTVTFRQSARAGRLKVDYRGLQAPSFTTVNPDNEFDPVNFQNLTRSLFGSRESVRAFAMDNQAQVDVRSGDWKHKILVGVDYQHNNFETNTYSGGSAPDLNIANPYYFNGPFEIPDPYEMNATRLTQTGVYLQDQIKWRDTLQLTLGGRYDTAKSSVFNRLDGTSTAVSDHKFTSRAGLVYLAPNGWAPYLSYSESFQPTGVVDPVTKEPFKPESGRQYEVGLRYQPPGTKNSFSAAIFDLRRKNYISYDTEFQPKQTGEISVRGLELEATTQPIDRMNLTASYSYTPRAIVTSSARPEEIGKQANAVARNQLSAWGDYRFTNGIKVGLGVRYTGPTNGNGGGSPIKVPGVTLLDAMVGYDFEHWSLALNVRNLTNKTYIANCDTPSKSCYYGDQRKVLATATYRW
jgi:iron complex outermembrane receptor protein